LSDSEYKRLNNTGKQLREKLVAELQAQSYDVISPRRSKIRLERVGIEDIKIDYDPEADRVIFGKLLTVSNYITIKAYLYGSENGIRTSHEPLLITTINRQSHELNDPEEINIAVKEIIAGLSLDRSDGEEESSKRTEELEQERQEELARQEELKRKEKEELARQLELKRKEKEELAQQAELKQKEKEELAQQAESKRKEQKAIDKSTKVCSKAPGVTLILAGGLMGGAGVYLRSKAKKIYDEEYVPIYEEDPNARDKLDEARKPNQAKK